MDAYGWAYLEEVLKVTGSKALHLGHIVCKPTDGFLPKWGNEAESETPQMYQSAPTGNRQHRPLPSVKLIDSLCGVSSKDAEYVNKEGLPYPKLKLM